MEFSILAIAEQVDPISELTTKLDTERATLILTPCIYNRR